MNVLISYGHDQYENLALRLKSDLEKENINVWMDKSQIYAGVKWEDAIERGITSSDWIILLMSEHSVRRPDGVCLDEISYARGLGKNILPIKVQDVCPPLSVARIHPLEMLNCFKPNEKGNNSFNEEAYQAKKTELCDILTGRKHLSHEDAWSAVHGALNPLDNDVYIIQSRKKFYGRQKAQDCYNEWYNSDQRLLWFSGDAGVGKTAFIENLCNTRGEICSVHFCKYYSNERANSKRIIMSLAYYLATQIPEYETALMTLRDLNYNSLLEKDSGGLFDYLFVGPLNKISYDGAPVVIVVDALDEATINAQNDLAVIINRQFEYTPKWLKLVITSRKEEALERTLSQYNNQVDLNDSEIQEDIRDFLKVQLADSLPANNKSQSKKLLDQIARKSDGNFLYATELVKEIKSGMLDLSKIDSFPQGLNGIYQEYFKRIFGSKENEIQKYKNGVRPVMEVLCATSEPLSDLKICQILNLDEYDFQDISDCICEMFPNKSGKIEPIHKSIIDWLIDHKKSGQFSASIKNGHMKISQYYLNQIYENDKGIDDYAVKYLCNHLIKCGNFSEAIKLLCDYNFIFTKRMEIMKLDSTVRLFLAELKEIYQHSFQDVQHVFSSAVFLKLFTEYRQFFYNSGLYFELTSCGFDIFLEQYHLPLNDEGQISMAYYYYITESFEKAIGVVNNIFEQSNALPSSQQAELHNLLALCYRKRVKFEEASDHFKRVLNISKTTSEYYNPSIALINLGKIAYHELKWDEADHWHKNAKQYLHNELERTSDSDYRSSLGLFLAEYHRLTAEYFIWRQMSSMAKQELEQAQIIYEDIPTRDRYYIRFLYTSAFQDLLMGQYEDVYDNCDDFLSRATSSYDKSQILFYKAIAAYKLDLRDGCFQAIQQAYQYVDEIGAWLEMEEIYALNSLHADTPLHLEHTDLYQNDQTTQNWISYVKEFLVNLK